MEHAAILYSLVVSCKLAGDDSVLTLQSRAPLSVILVGGVVRWPDPRSALYAGGMQGACLFPPGWYMAMIVVLKPDSTQKDVAALVGWLADMDAAGYVSAGRQRTIEVLGAGPGLDRRHLEQMPAVDCVLDEQAQVLQVAIGSRGGTREVPLGPRAGRSL